MAAGAALGAAVALLAREQLRGGGDVLALPGERARPARLVIEGRRRGALRAELTWARSQGLSRREGATLYMTLLAASNFARALRGQSDIVVGTDIANRTRGEIEPLIGFFVNQLVLRARGQRRLTVRQLLASVKEMTLGAYAHQDVPFEKLVEELGPAESGARAVVPGDVHVAERAARGVDATGGGVADGESWGERVGV